MPATPDYAVGSNTLMGMYIADLKTLYLFETESNPKDVLDQTQEVIDNAERPPGRPILGRQIRLPVLRSKTASSLDSRLSRHILSSAELTKPEGGLEGRETRILNAKLGSESKLGFCKLKANDRQGFALRIHRRGGDGRLLPIGFRVGYGGDSAMDLKP
nr:hypothetical protein Itr_chr08CG19040 [Ipomoea trifida]